MASAHAAVESASKRYFQQYKRYNYTTPKSYLELIGLYQGLVRVKREEFSAARDRLETGRLDFLWRVIFYAERSNLNENCCSIMSYMTYSVFIVSNFFGFKYF